MSEAFTNYDADEKDYDDDDETTSQQDQQKEPINFNEYQTPVSSVASYDSTESYSTNNDYSKQKENIYPSNPLSIANIVQNNERIQEGKDYSYSMQQYLSNPSFDQYQPSFNRTEPLVQQQQQQPQSNYESSFHTNSRSQAQEDQMIKLNKKVVPKVQAASAYLLQPPDSKSIAAAAAVASSNRNKRRTRTKFEAAQITLLENAFQRTHYPDVNLVDKIADVLKINTERISVWFQNRRARYKREKHHDPPPKIIEGSKDQMSIFDEYELSKDKSLDDELDNSIKTKRKTVHKTSMSSLRSEIPDTLDESEEKKEVDANDSNASEQQTSEQQQQQQIEQFNSQTNLYLAYQNQQYPYYYQQNTFSYPQFHVHPYMMDQRLQYANQYAAQRPVEVNEDSLSPTTSPSPNGSRSNSPASSCDVKSELQDYYQYPYAAANVTTDANVYNSVYKPYANNNAYPAIFQPYADCNSAALYNQQQATYQGYNYKN